MTSTPAPENTAGPPAPRPAAYAAMILWLGAGYAASLAIFSHLPWQAAIWQAALCLAATLPLLLTVVHIISLPKLLRKLPRALLTALWMLGNLAHLLIPWLGWAALLWLLNRGGLTWAGALRAAAAITLFSYATAAVFILRFRPRPYDVEITRTDVPIPDLPEPFHGYRILHLSDLHAGHFLPIEALRARLQAARSLHPDLIVFTGDLADRKVRRAKEAAGLLADIASADGLVAVLGNHDNWIGEEQVRTALTDRGLTVLVNQHTAVPRDAARLYLAGVGDASYTGRDDVAAALAGIPEAALVILLSHSPDIIRKLPARGPALVLCGHTHGGQIVLPLIGPLYVPSRVGRRFAAGLHRINAGWLYVNRGLGEVFPPVRIGCPPEISLLTLTPAQSSD